MGRDALDLPAGVQAVDAFLKLLKERILTSFVQRVSLLSKRRVLVMQNQKSMQQADQNFVDAKAQQKTRSLRGKLHPEPE